MSGWSRGDGSPICTRTRGSRRGGEGARRAEKNATTSCEPSKDCLRTRIGAANRRKRWRSKPSETRSGGGLNPRTRRSRMAESYARCAIERHPYLMVGIDSTTGRMKRPFLPTWILTSLRAHGRHPSPPSWCLPIVIVVGLSHPCGVLVEEVPGLGNWALMEKHPTKVPVVPAATFRRNAWKATPEATG